MKYICSAAYKCEYVLCVHRNVHELVTSGPRWAGCLGKRLCDVSIDRLELTCCTEAKDEKYQDIWEDIQ